MSEVTQNKLWIAAVLWLCLAGGALFAMAGYGADAGKMAEPPTLWPLDAQAVLTTEKDKPTLVMFAHPLCPCTRATLWELESMTNRLYGLFNTQILFYEPEDTRAMEQIWQASDLKTIARKLPGASIHNDVDGELAKYFGAYTSGQVLLYGSDKKLRFKGGITPSRGHTGTNPGKASVISTILTDSAVDPLSPALNPVYGCSLHNDDQTDDRKIKTNTSPL